jgi:hypothetical protein
LFASWFFLTSSILTKQYNISFAINRINN